MRAHIWRSSVAGRKERKRERGESVARIELIKQRHFISAVNYDHREMAAATCQLWAHLFAYFCLRKWWTPSTKRLRCPGPSPSSLQSRNRTTFSLQIHCGLLFVLFSVSALPCHKRRIAHVLRAAPQSTLDRRKTIIIDLSVPFRFHLWHSRALAPSVRFTNLYNSSSAFTHNGHSAHTFDVAECATIWKINRAPAIRYTTARPFDGQTNTHSHSLSQNIKTISNCDSEMNNNRFDLWSSTRLRCNWFVEQMRIYEVYASACAATMFTMCPNVYVRTRDAGRSRRMRDMKARARERERATSETEKVREGGRELIFEVTIYDFELIPWTGPQLNEKGPINKYFIYALIRVTEKKRIKWLTQPLFETNNFMCASAFPHISIRFIFVCVWPAMGRGSYSLSSSLANPNDFYFSRQTSL